MKIHVLSDTAQEILHHEINTYLSDEMAIDLNALQRWLAQWYWFLDKMINIMNKKNLRELLGIHTNSPLYPGQACGLCDQSKQDPSY